MNQLSRQGRNPKALNILRHDLLNRNYILAWFVALLLFMAFDSMIPVLPVYMEMHEGVSGAAGLPLAAITLGALLIRPFAGWALDAYGRKKLFWGGILLFLLPAICYIGMIPAALLIALRVIQGSGFGSSNTAIFTLATDINPKKQMGMGMGYFTATMSLSVAIAPTTTSWMLGRHVSYPVIFTVSALFIVVAFILALLIRYPAYEKKEVKPHFVFFTRTALKPALVTLFVAINFSSVISFVPVNATMQGILLTGIFFTAESITSLVLRPVSGMLVDKKKEKGFDLTVLVGAVLVIVAILVLAQLSSLASLIIGGIFFGAGFAFLQPTMLALSVKDATPENRGAANATYWTAFDSGVFLGSIIWGPIAALLGYRTMFHLALIPVGLALLIYFSQRVFPFYTRAKEPKSNVDSA